MDINNDTVSEYPRRTGTLPPVDTQPAITRPPTVAVIRGLRATDWLRVAAWTIVAGAAIAVPARLVPNDLFRRMTPTRPQDYVFWVIGAALTGAVLGLPRSVTSRTDAAAMTGGLGTFLAVGCPVCNKVVVALIGVGGATSIFAPIQPVLGVGSLALLVWALRARLRSLSSPACAVPSP